MEKPRILVSKCFGMVPCRWNNLTVESKLIEHLLPWFEVVSVCPEVEIGLGVPRRPVRLVRSEKQIDLYQPATDMFFTDQMKSFSQDFIKELGALDGALLKAKSPTCGPHGVKVYHKGIPNEKGMGLFMGHLSQKYPLLPIEDEGRLNNFALRDQWLIQVFANAEYRSILCSKKKNDLIQFHARYKYLLMACSNSKQKELGRLVASAQSNDTFFEDYQGLFQETLTHPLRQSGLVNALEHIYGYFKKDLTKQEKEFFFDTIEEFRRGGLPLSVPISLLRSWALRFDAAYIKSQALLRPYPQQLELVTDSGKGRAF